MQRLQLNLRLLVIALGIGGVLGLIFASSSVKGQTNPFRPRLVGELLSWDEEHVTGWIRTGEMVISVRVEGDVIGSPPRAGCQVEAHGTYAQTSNRPYTFVAHLLIVQPCGGLTIDEKE